MICADANSELKYRMLADTFESYCPGPMQKIAGEALLPNDQSGTLGFRLWPGPPDGAKHENE